ncbi:hypothetical protein [Bacillus sp. FJAT-27225]|nr:hypothetical protein [Bacillus sp. FJAT-27225]
MVKKWAIAAVAYLALVMAGYGIYSATAGADEVPQQEQSNH